MDGIENGSLTVMEFNFQESITILMPPSFLDTGIGELLYLAVDG